MWTPTSGGKVTGQSEVRRDDARHADRIHEARVDRIELHTDTATRRAGSP